MSWRISLIRPSAVFPGRYIKHVELMLFFIDYFQPRSIVAHGKRYLHSSLQRYKNRVPCTVETSWTNLPGSGMHPQLRRRHQVWSGQRMYWCRRSRPQQETPGRASWPLCSMQTCWTQALPRGWWPWEAPTQKQLHTQLMSNQVLHWARAGEAFSPATPGPRRTSRRAPSRCARSPWRTPRTATPAGAAAARGGTAPGRPPAGCNPQPLRGSTSSGRRRGGGQQSCTAGAWTRTTGEEDALLPLSPFEHVRWGWERRKS